jgi:hypothetical protein
MACDRCTVLSHLLFTSASRYFSHLHAPISTDIYGKPKTLTSHCTKHPYILTPKLSIQDSYYTGIRIAKSDDAFAGAIDEQGKLTKTGLLYEGNYDEWESRLWDMLELLGIDSDRPGRLESGVPIAYLIKSMVIPRLLSISRERARMVHISSWRENLLLPLKLAAKPFRLMGLPIDVRTRIWKFTIASQQGPMRYTITAESPFKKGRIHPVTRVSREVRVETLAIAWVKVRVEFKPSAVQFYNLKQLSSRYANRFHQLGAFEQSNRVSRILPDHAFFPVFAKGRPQLGAFLMLELSLSSSIEVVILHPAPRHAIRLTPLALHKIRSHLDLASRLLGASCSSTAFVVMALLGAPSLWEQSNVECEWEPMNSTLRKKPRSADDDNPEMYFHNGYRTVLRELFND